MFSQFLWNLAFIFSDSPEKFSLVLLQILSYLFRPWKMFKKNAIIFKLFWYKVFVHWELKLLNFLMDSVLKALLTIWKFCFLTRGENRSARRKTSRSKGAKQWQTNPHISMRSHRQPKLNMRVLRLPNFQNGLYGNSGNKYSHEF